MNVKEHEYAMIQVAMMMHVRPGTINEFESAIRRATPLMARAAGYIGQELYKCVEEADKYMLLVTWRSITDHIAGFCKSDDYAQWAALLQPYCDPPPASLHYVKIKM